MHDPFEIVYKNSRHLIQEIVKRLALSSSYDGGDGQLERPHLRILISACEPHLVITVPGNCYGRCSSSIRVILGDVEAIPVLCSCASA